MTLSIRQRLEALRGGLPAEPPGARGIERLARNPQCLTLKALTIAGIRPATAVAKILGMPDAQALSPFAMAIANRFERRMLESSAAMLFTLYREQRVLAANEARIINIEELAPGAAPLAKRRRETETRRILALRAQGESNAPNLMIKPRVTVMLAGIPYAIEPDYLVAADADPFYRVGELKSYADREGKTDPADTRSALRQAAVGVVALRQELQYQGVLDPRALVPAKADLVLRGPGSLNPRLSRMTLEGEVDSLERALADAPQELAELETLLGEGGALNDAAVLASLPYHYRDSCKDHCEMWKFCRNRALAAGEPSILGDVAAEHLAAAGSLSRALDLLNGRGGSVRTQAEAMLAAELRAADAQLQTAVGNG